MTWLLLTQLLEDLTMSDNNSIQKRTFTAIRTEFSGIAFRRGKDNVGGFVLQGIPELIFQDICSRLFMLKCKLINHYFSEVSNTYAIHFTASAEVAARLSALVPLSDRISTFENRWHSEQAGNSLRESC
jgi:hypothetical protein